MIRRTNDSFLFLSHAGNNINAWDVNFGNSSPIGANGSQWTAGVTNLSRVQAFSSITKNNATLIGFTISARLALIRNSVDTTSPTFGKLGKILAGITTDATNTTGTGSDPESNGILFLPSDLSLVGDLWDPHTDNLPPSFLDNANIGNGGLQVGVTQTLPQPVPLVRGANNIFVGIWILPSLISATQPNQFVSAKLMVKDATWSMVYDDGE